jgi:hypothetical protein
MGWGFEKYNDAERAAHDLFTSWMRAQRTAERGTEVKLPSLCIADVTDSTRLTRSRGHPTGEEEFNAILDVVPEWPPSMKAILEESGLGTLEMRASQRVTCNSSDVSRGT